MNVNFGGTRELLLIWNCR